MTADPKRAAEAHAEREGLTPDARSYEPCISDFLAGHAHASAALAARDAVVREMREALTPPTDPEDDGQDGDICADCKRSVSVRDGCDWEPGEDICDSCVRDRFDRARAALKRLDEAEET